MGKRFRYLSSQHAFTLVELLIVIAILGILGGGIIAAINPLAKINSANLAKAKTFAASVENNLAIDQVGKWSFEDGSGTTVKDTSGYNAQGTLNGTINANPPNNTWQTSCVFGGCLYFDGSTNYVSIPDSASLDTSYVTVEAWIKPNLISGSSRTIVGKSYISDGTGTRLWELTSDTNGKLYWLVSINGTNVPYKEAASSNGAIAVGNWYHVVGTYNSPNAILYINGTRIASSQESTPGPLQPNNRPVVIGSPIFGVAWFNGLIDEVKIYNQALSLSQIQQLYAQGLPKHTIAYGK